MDERESIEYSWVNIAVGGRITDQPCELICIDVSPSGANAEAIIYNGNDASGQVIQDIFSAVKLNFLFAPIKPVYCDKGLAIVFTANVTRAFVQFRLIPHE